MLLPRFIDNITHVFLNLQTMELKQLCLEFLGLCHFLCRSHEKHAFQKTETIYILYNNDHEKYLSTKGGLC